MNDRHTDYTTCPNCGSAQLRTYCPDCGQKNKVDFSVRSILSDFGEFVWGSDSRLIRTLGDYLDPGIYLKNWFDGKRARYISPIKMFLLINLIYFVSLAGFHSFGVGFDTLVTSYHGQLENQIYSSVIRGPAETLTNHSGLEEHEFAERYNNRVFTTSNSFVLVLSLIIACMLFLINFRRSGLLYHHINAGLYYGGFLLFLMLTVNIILAISLGIMVITGTEVTWVFSDLFVTVFMACVLTVVTFFVQKRVYQQQFWINLLKALFFGVVLISVSVLIYRFLLFWITSLFVLMSI